MSEITEQIFHFRLDTSFTCDVKSRSSANKKAEDLGSNKHAKYN